MKRLKNAGLLLLFLAIGFLPSLSALVIKTDGWYASLYKPVWTPSDVVFAPVWTVLYAMVGLAGFFAWTRSKAPSRRAEFAVYGIQLVLNGLWTLFFFGMHQIGWALGVLVLLWFEVHLCVSAFWFLNRTAAWLLVPYFLWVSFACALNAAIMMIN